jgi:DNA-directed RNA polymerase subunit RPC12/RpoP
MEREHLVCADCGEHYESDLFTEDPGETFVCPLCGTLILVPAQVALAAAATPRTQA